MSTTLAFDDMEWIRDEVLIQADEWQEIMAGAERAQARDIQYMLMDLCPMRNNPRLSFADRARVARTIDRLRAQLLRLRR